MSLISFVSLTEHLLRFVSVLCFATKRWCMFMYHIFHRKCYTCGIRVEYMDVFISNITHWLIVMWSRVHEKNSYCYILILLMQNCFKRTVVGYVYSRYVLIKLEKACISLNTLIWIYLHNHELRSGSMDKALVTPKAQVRFQTRIYSV